MGFTFIPHKKELIDAAIHKALFAAQEQILTDCNFFVRQDQGTLRASGHTQVSGNTMQVVYDTPYARRVYYTGTPSRDVNPNASLQWCHKAGSSYSVQWQTLLEEGVKSAL